MKRIVVLCGALLASMMTSLVAQDVARDTIAPAARDADAVAPNADVQDLIVFCDSRPLLVRLHVTLDGKPFRERWTAFLDQTFKRLDRDEDGELSSDEAARAPAIELGTAINFRVDPNYRNALQLKAARDGKISRDAFLAFYESTDAAAFSTRAGQGRSGTAKAVIELLDSDRDRRLSAAELRAAEASLRRRDYDDDETVTDQELVPGQNVLGQVVIMDRPGATASRSSFVFVIQPTTKPSEIADALLARFDLNKNGSLAVAAGVANELQLAPATAAELDRDFDGSLDRDEISQFAARAPDLKLQYSIGPSGTLTLDPTGSNSSATLPTRKLTDGDNRPGAGDTDLAYLTDAGDTQLEFRLSNARNNLVVRQVAQIQFAQLDQDKNGYIDDAESKRIAFIAVAFKPMDRDDDGKVSKEEYDSYNELLREAATTRLSLEVTDEGQQLFEMLDKNRDGRLTLRELRAASELLDKADADHDLALAGSEIPRRLRIELSRGNAAANTAGRLVVAGGMQPVQARRTAPTIGPLWFTKMDRNHDGDLSQREFLGSREDFERLDTNHDRLIDTNEAKAGDSN